MFFPVGLSSTNCNYGQPWKSKLNKKNQAEKKFSGLANALTDETDLQSKKILNFM